MPPVAPSSRSTSTAGEAHELAELTVLDREGNEVRRTDGGVGQLGGVLIVSPDGSVAFSYLSADASDVPSNAEALLAARKAVRALAGPA